MMVDKKKLDKLVKEHATLYKGIKKIYRFFKPNLRNQMMYQMVSEPMNHLIKEKDKILIVAPHPDDEVISCGGIIAKYASQIDVLCINSSGVKYEKDSMNADEIADVRINEFYNVMESAKVNKAWIAKIWGTPPMFKQIKANLNEYINRFDWQEYDFIFVPHKMDGHREHRYVGNYLVPKILKKTGYKKGLRIVRYEVWGSMHNPNYFEDISEQFNEKERLINLYVTRQAGEYAARIGALNYYRGIVAKCKYAEAFRVEPVKKYLRQLDDKSWSRQ